MSKKIYLKVYQDRENMKQNYFIETPEKIMAMLPDLVKDSNECATLFPVFEPIELTDEEFENLPDFVGY